MSSASSSSSTTRRGRKRPRGGGGGRGGRGRLDGGRPSRSGGLSLDKFVKTGANDAAFHRKRKREAYYEKAKVVNRYNRLLRKEGLAPTSSSAATEREKRRKLKPHERQRIKKATFNPMEASTKRSRSAEADAAAKKKEAADRDAARAKKLAVRKRNAKRMAKKNYKGQPILKYQIDAIVGKLLKE